MACTIEMFRMVVTWINWVLMLALGLYNVYVQFDDNEYTQDKVQKVLSIYIAVFGLIGVIFEAKVKAFYNNIVFLQSKSGRGVFFIFVGTLCFAIAGGNMKRATSRAAAYLMGAFGCFTGIVQFVTLCFFREKDDDDEAVDPITQQPITGPSSI